MRDAVKIQSGESGILPGDEDKFTRREGRISFAAKDKILFAKINVDSARDKI